MLISDNKLIDQWEDCEDEVEEVEHLTEIGCQ